MLRNRLYYRIKPLVPRNVRLAIRRQVALRKREQVRDIWPILPGSEKPPAGWTGWPDGKKFALVITHDVEGPEGLAKCLALAEIEKKLGFRSSFNFIPEGPYQVSKELRDELTGQGFEVGVHDLEHNGKLFHNRADFLRKAQKINTYLKDWGAAGFRSGFMLHNLDWLHDLNVQYDASTFDTDPFEPQPEGRNTIFPFWVPRQKKHAPEQSSILNPQSSICAAGYIELPYTLPQDSTLFLLLREGSSDIWIRKLDWIAQQGGMALVNVHPDYVRLPGEAKSIGTYDVARYIDLLKHIRASHEGMFWQPLPREMATFVHQKKPEPPRKPRRIGMITYSHFLSDARVKRYAEALAERGDEVDVIALRRSEEMSPREKLGNINLIRLQPRYGKNEKSPVAFLLPVLRFLCSSSLWITRQHLRQRYDLLHIHNIPDFLVFAGWLPKLTGTKVILDIHDIVPEFYASKFKVSEDSFSIRALRKIEFLSARFANHVIISNDLWREKYATRTRTEKRCSVFINNVDSETFRSRPRTRNDEKLIVLFPGGLQWHQGLDIAIRAFQKVVAALPNAEFHIYGDGNMKQSLIALTAELGLNHCVRFSNPLPVQQIAEIMANADLGVVPKRADSFGNEAYSTKIMEFMSLGIPMVVSSTRIDRFYFDDSVVRFFESGNSDALAEAMLAVLQNEKLRHEMIHRASQYAALYSWESRKRDYLALVDALLSRKTIPEKPHGSISGPAMPNACVVGPVMEMAAPVSPVETRIARS
jgi:glycosyltransferase involved in cell wall biosynthesis